MKKITIYTLPFCRYCTNAITFFNNHQLTFEEIDLTGKPELKEALDKQTGFTSIPKIFIGETCIGGFSDLEDLHLEGKLENLLSIEIESK